MIVLRTTMDLLLYTGVVKNCIVFTYGNNFFFVSRTKTKSNKNKMTLKKKCYSFFFKMMQILINDQVFDYDMEWCYTNGTRITPETFFFWLGLELRKEGEFNVRINSFPLSISRPCYDDVLQQVIRSEMKKHSRTFTIVERVSPMADKEAKGYEREWIGDGTTFTSGDTKLTTNQFKGRMEYFVRSLPTLVAGKRNASTADWFSLTRPDMQITITWNLNVQIAPKEAESNLAGLSVMLC